jgi:hypothetical protein
MALSKIKAPSIADDSITVDQIADNAVHGRRNLIINGAMNIAQRGTSETGVATTGYKAAPDRFKIAYEGTTSQYTVSQDTSAPDGFESSYKIQCTTADTSLAASSQVALLQYIEAQDLQQLKYGLSSAEKVTLSFYVKSNTTGTYAVNLYSQDGSRIIGSTYSISSADTWEQKTLTFDGDTSGTINDDAGRGIEVKWFISAGSTYTATDNTSWGAYADGKIAYGHAVDLADSTSDNWAITGVQLEIGDKATPFEYRSFGEELSLCHRYTFAMQGTGDPLGSKGGAAIVGGSRGFWGFGSAHNSGNPVVWMEMPTAMRGVPSLTKSSSAHFDFDRGWAGLATSTNTIVQTLRSSSKTLAIIMTTSGLSNGDAGSMSANNSAAYMIYDAEL